MIPLRNRDILIEKLREGLSIEEACKESQISKPSLYRLMKKEPGLQTAFENAVFDAKHKALETERAREQENMAKLKKMIVKRK